jgi:hypothetical protein
MFNFFFVKQLFPGCIITVIHNYILIYFTELSIDLLVIIIQT